MNFFEQELRKIIAPRNPDATYVGRACYVRLGDLNRAKIHFTTCGTAYHYDALQITILNRNDGQVDSLRLRFVDVLGKKQVSNPNFRNGISPYAWTDSGQTEWYVYKPNAGDYQKLSEALGEYLELFQEQTQAPAPQWQQTM